MANETPVHTKIDISENGAEAAGSKISILPSSEVAEQITRSIAGCILGTAAGDALGLCAEGMSRQRQMRLYPELNGYRFLFGHGMVSDDTEHTIMVAQALIVSAGDVVLFQRVLARQLRWWLLGLPGGVGLATLRATIKLWLGRSAAASGVYSAGNGPAMRSALLGVCYGHDRRLLRQLVSASTRITHTDPKAEAGAMAAALAAYISSAKNIDAPDFHLPDYYLSELRATLTEDELELQRLVESVVVSIKAGRSTLEFADALGLSKGVSGYIYHTVPVVLHAWLRSPNDFRSGVLEAIRCGGDTDTMAAILGGIIGGKVGVSGIPADWRRGLWEWPRNVRWMENLADRLSETVIQGSPHKLVSIPLLAVLPRNLAFLAVVISHGIRRLFPPY